MRTAWLFGPWVVSAGQGRGARGVAELRHEAMPLELGPLGQAAEGGERRVDVEQLGGLRADSARLDARAGDDQGDPRRAVPERVLAADPLLAQVPAVVGQEHHDRVRRQAARLERIEHAADLAVDEARAREVGADQRLPLARPACSDLSRGSGRRQCRYQENSGVSSRSLACTGGRIKESGG